jgi:hypothetical protein
MDNLNRIDSPLFVRWRKVLKNAPGLPELSIIFKLNSGVIVIMLTNNFSPLADGKMMDGMEAFIPIADYVHAIDIAIQSASGLTQ